MTFREIMTADIQSLFYVRSRTRENTYTLEELTRAGITEESVSQKLSASYKGWLCEIDKSVVGFSMADRDTGELWVIAVLPEFECQGIGNRLMALAEAWLWEMGCDRGWLTTSINKGFRAYGFYLSRGWADYKIEDGLRYMQIFPPQSA
jgi:GNAT superfamily N-acetyltransferase